MYYHITKLEFHFFSHMMNWIYGTTTAVIMSPEPYTIFHGEKVVHRYYLGTGEEGRENVNKVVKMIEDRNNRRNDHLYNSFYNNCTNLAIDIENFVVRKIGARLMDLNSEQIFPPFRTKLTREKKEETSSLSPILLLIYLYQLFVILFHKVTMNILFFVPIFSAMLGRGIGVKAREAEEIRGQLRALQWKAGTFPKNLRVRQLYTLPYRKHSVSFST